MIWTASYTFLMGLSASGWTKKKNYTTIRGFGTAQPQSLEMIYLLRYVELVGFDFFVGMLHDQEFVMNSELRQLKRDIFSIHPSSEKVYEDLYLNSLIQSHSKRSTGYISDYLASRQFFRISNMADGQVWPPCWSKGFKLPYRKLKHV